jgi:effector-binding domain-containing protein
MTEYRVVVKKVSDVRGLGIREKVAGPAGIGELLGDGFAGLSRVGAMVTGAPVAVYHDPEFSPESIDLELVYPVPAWVKGPLATPGGRALEQRTVPGGEVAAIVYTGPYGTIGEAYQMLADWIGEYGYRVSGPPRELYLRLPTDPGAPVTEVRQPVERVADQPPLLGGYSS